MYHDRLKNTNLENYSGSKIYNKLTIWNFIKESIRNIGYNKSLLKRIKIKLL